MLREKMVERVGANHFGEVRRETREAKAERIVKDELKQIGWRAKDLERSKNGCEEKVRIANRVRNETTVSLAWISQRLHMGTANYLNNRLYLWRKGKLKGSRKIK